MNVQLGSDLLAERLTDGSLGKRERAEEVARSFEQIFVRQMVKGMRDSVGVAGGEGMFGKGPGSGTYADWFDKHFSRHLITNGGIGLADTMLRNWERQGWIEPRDPQGETDVRA
jgi:Rod binding domain-containing protein